jgi:hypothetical protein
VLGQQVEALVAGDAGKHPQPRGEHVRRQRGVQRPPARAARPPQVAHRDLWSHCEMFEFTLGSFDWFQGGATMAWASVRMCCAGPSLAVTAEVSLTAVQCLALARHAG